ncbi:MAG: hypothetical protein JWR50_3589 [Mucilaginibacter sp.]|nr:hypothetical protein [Mucilaginibacter sp.]
MLNFGKQFFYSIVMKQLEVFHKIGGIIKELNDQYKYIEATPENLNDLELELFVANAHFLADHAEILSKLSQRNKLDKAVQQPAEPKQPVEPEKPKEPAPVIAEKFFEPVVQQPKREPQPEADGTAAHIDLTAETPKDSYSFIREEPEVIRHELVVDESDYEDEDIEEELVDEVIPEEPEPAKPASVPEVKTKEVAAIEVPKEPIKEVIKPVVKNDGATKDKEEILTINQRISAQKVASANITEQAGTQAITNLKQAITLNDKLLYIKDLFNGYSLAYSEAIEILNRFNSFEEANRFLTKNYTVKNNWDSKPDTANKFFELLKRRYAN